MFTDTYNFIYTNMFMYTISVHTGFTLTLHKHTRTQTHIHTHTNTHARTHTHTYTRTLSLSPTHKHARSFFLSLSLSFSLSSTHTDCDFEYAIRLVLSKGRMGKNVRILAGETDVARSEWGTALMCAYFFFEKIFFVQVLYKFYFRTRAHSRYGVCVWVCTCVCACVHMLICRNMSTYV